MSMSKQNNSLVERWFDDDYGFEVPSSSEPQKPDSILFDGADCPHYDDEEDN